MASNITELFGYSPRDKSAAAIAARRDQQCPFLGQTCLKTLNDKTVSGVCSIKLKSTGPVICCPIRLYAGDYQIHRDVASQAFGNGIDLVIGGGLAEYRDNNPGKTCIIVFGKRWGKELRLPNRAKKKGGKKTGAYFVDWILAHVDASGKLHQFRCCRGPINRYDWKLSSGTERLHERKRFYGNQHGWIELGKCS